MRNSAQSIRLDTRTNLGVHTKHHFAPTAIQGLEVLALPIASLTEYLSGMLEENPLLDYDFSKDLIQFDELPLEDAPHLSDNEDFVSLRDEGSFALVSRGDERGTFDLQRLQDDCLETETLRFHLRIQMTRSNFSPAQRAFIDEIIEAIDDNGYFANSLELLAQRACLPMRLAETLLGEVQTCFPRGVGARSISECLLLQLDKNEKNYLALAAIIREDLLKLAENKTSYLMQKYHVTREVLSEIRERIQSLNPRPGSTFYQQQQTNYLMPDIVIHKRASGFTVEIVGELTNTLSLNKEYLSLLDEGLLDKETMLWLQNRKDEAQLTLRNISQRKQTLYRFGRFLVEAQYDFFLFGEQRLKPLTMQCVADSIGLHVSTISRIVQDKYALTPWGLYPLKFFFSNSLTCNQADYKTELSSFVVKARIKQIISQGDTGKPLSDASLTDILNHEGIEIKRRTVAKYRKSLGIERQSLRRV